MAIAKLDIAQLSLFCSLPQESITQLLDAPSSQLVRSLLEGVAVKAHDYHDLVSKKLKLRVELESIVRGGESKNRLLKTSVEKALKEAADLRQTLKEEENARAVVQAELDKLKGSTAESSSELASQKSRISELESSNRGTLSLLEAKTTACDKLADELNAEHQKNKDLRRDTTILEQSVQSANNANTTAKLHKQELQQEIESLKRCNEWLETELKTKSGEHNKFRKEKSFRIAELQRLFDGAQSTIDAANRSETNLRRRLDEVSQKADDSFAKIQQLQEEAAKKDESFRIELDAANRLTELTRNSANTERKRQQELYAQLEATKEEASAQIGGLGAELETEHRDREVAEARVAELEAQIEQLQANLSSFQSRPSMEATHHQGINGHATPARGTSTPLDSPSTPWSKGGLSRTQMYSNYSNIKSDLEFEKRRNAKLSSTLDEMIQDLETRQPEIEELRMDHDRLVSEVAEMSSLVDVTGKERDQALTDIKKWEGQMEAKMQESEVLRQQLRDLSSQVKMLLMEAHLRNQGQDDISTESRAQLEQVALGRINGEATEGMTDTSRFISESLVTFKTIGELQEQNMNLLKITRELGEKMEHEESVRKQMEKTRDWDELQHKYERCKDEVRSLLTQSQSYIRERDMFRRMLLQRGRLPPDTDAGSVSERSLNGATPSAVSIREEAIGSIEDPPSGKNLADYARLYKDIQAHFDAYRDEAATDRSTLKEQVEGLSRLNGELRSEVVRGNSQVHLAHERYEMLQANFAMLKNENAELQKRSQSLSDGAARQEFRVQQIAEDLVEAKGLTDSMRNEIANLKAEKEFWKTVEKRLTNDNEQLLEERNRLNNLTANLQNLLNERERSDNESRRKWQVQIDGLERDLYLTKDKLSGEMEEKVRMTQRREYDNEQSRKRVDDLTSSLGTIREELVAATTTKDHLSAKVDELIIELRSAEERANVLRLASKAHASSNDRTEIHDTSTTGPDSSLAKEQRLAVQLAEVTRDLDLTRVELENLKGQVEQYKAISQASEDELRSSNETQDLYRQETDVLIHEKNLRIEELEHRIEDIVSELSSTNSELSALRNEQAEHGRHLDDQKKAFKAEIAEIKDRGDRHAAAAQYYQEDLKVQANIAQQAQQNYESELVKHADAAKALQKVRADYNDLRLQILSAKTEAESARTNLVQSEESWSESRNRYERELRESKAGREDLTAQNNRLHQQFEHVTIQISSLKQSSSTNEAISNDRLSQPGLDNLQEIIKYLRREKEIVDVQLELSIQEGKRLKQQLDYAQSQLDDTRLRLNQQRRADGDRERLNLDHNKMVETINELNTFRESNVTLRTESRQAQAALVTKNTEVDELKSKIEPLQAEILELINARESQEGEMKLIKENSDRWQQRAQNVLQKYDRIDPAELEASKEQVKKLIIERDELIQAKQHFQEQVDTLSTQISQVQEQGNEKLESMRTRLTDQFKARSKTQSDKIKEKDAALQVATSEKQRLEQQVSEMSKIQAEVQSARAERDATIERASIQSSVANSKAFNGSEDGQLEEGESSGPARAETQSMQDSVLATETTVNKEGSGPASLLIQLEKSQRRVAELEEEIKRLQDTVSASETDLPAERSQQRQENTKPNDELQQQIISLQADLAQAESVADNLRMNASINASIAKAPSEDDSKGVAEQVADHVEAVRVELEIRHQARVKEAEETLDKRTNNMKAQLSRKLAEGKAQIRQNLVQEHEDTVRRLRAEHSQEMEQLVTRHKSEIHELRQSEDSRYLNLQEAWEKNRQVSAQNNQISDTHTENQDRQNSWNPSESETRAFLRSNDVARNIIKNNIITQVNKAKDELTARLKEEHEAAMRESQDRANTAKEHAVMMEGKKTALQINMANNKARISQFKIGIVEKAAHETPQKPVEEVWSLAKDARPPPVATSQPQQGTSKNQSSSLATTSGPSTRSNQHVQSEGGAAPSEQANAFAQNALTAQQNIAPSISGQPISFDQGHITTPQGTTQANVSAQNPSFATLGPQIPGPPSVHASLSNDQRTSALEQPARNQVSPSTVKETQHSSEQEPQGTMQKPSQSITNHHPNAGTRPGTSRGLQQSSLPVARAGSTRGMAIVRGRGSGTGRGGPPGINTNQGQQQGRNSPTRGGLNPGARQFVPGSKRPREEEQEGGEAGNGKKIRGSGRSGGNGGDL